MTTALSEVAAIVYRESGIRISERQHSFLLAALERVGTGPTPEGFLRSYADPLLRAQLRTRLIDEVTVKETSFLRDHHQLGTIDWQRLLAGARADGSEQIRIWTAACATGEEAYSLALLAHEAFAPDPPPVSILATDISAAALAYARAGVYRARSVRELSPAARSRYFRDEAGGLAAGDHLRDLVSFELHNLVADPFPPAGHAPFQLILCRNVLIYFDGETVGRVLESFDRALAGSGTLVLGVADALCASASRLAEAAPGRPSEDVPGATPGRAWREARSRRPRRPQGQIRAAAPVEDLALVLERPDGDGTEQTIEWASRLVEQEPLNAGAHYRLGLAELERGDPTAAVASLRRALFVEPHFGLAAFKLGGAHEARGDRPAARRAYQQALRALEPHERHEPFLDQVDIADVAVAARARLDALAAPVA